METTLAPGHGLIDDSSQGKGSLDLRPLLQDLDGRLVKEGRDFCRHIREVNGCQGKGPAFSSLGPGQFWQLETEMAIVFGRSWRSTAGAAAVLARTATMESGLG